MHKSLPLGTSSFSSFLDLVRWVAAFIVLLGHARGLLFFGWGELSSDQKGILSIPWYFVSGLFSEAVIVFFVLSGYLVALRALHNENLENFSLRRFFIDRYTRLYIAFLPALIITLFIDYIGISALKAGGYYDGSQITISKTLVGYTPFEQNFNLLNFFGNLLMLQDFVVTPFGSNPPLWSIAYEFWFYTLFGISIKLYVLGTDLGRKRLFLGLILLLIYVSSLVLGPIFIVYMGIWLLGVSLVFIPALSIRFVIPCLVIFFSVLVFFRVAIELKSWTYFNVLKNYSTALSFCLLISSMKNYKGLWLINTRRLNSIFAGFSYSLYLLHYPLLVFILSLVSTLVPSLSIYEGFLPNNPIGLSLYVFLVFLCILFAYIFSRLTESKTQIIRASLYEMLSRRTHT